MSWPSPSGSCAPARRSTERAATRSGASSSRHSAAWRRARCRSASRTRFRCCAMSPPERSCAGRMSWDRTARRFAFGGTWSGALHRRQPQSLRNSGTGGARGLQTRWRARWRLRQFDSCLFRHSFGLHACIRYSEWRSDSRRSRGCVSMLEDPTAPEGMPMTRAYDVVDADGHILEPLDLWDNYIDPEFHERRPRFVIDENGKERLSVEGKLLGNPRGIGSLGAVGVRQGAVKLDSLKYAEGKKGGVDPHARSVHMDADGIDAALLYPSLGLFAAAVEDPELAAAICRAYNRS